MELIYPDTIAALLEGSSLSKAIEMLPVVDENGRVIAQASRTDLHHGLKALHPVVHLHLLNRSGEIYLQQRGADKDLLPLRWDTAVGGHLSYGEYIKEALYRETEEELHLTDFYPNHITSYVFESETEKELVNVFAAVGDLKPQPDYFELAGGRWWSVQEIEKTIGKEVLTPNFEQEFKRIRKSLLALL